jgi:hypothetical protein
LDERDEYRAKDLSNVRPDPNSWENKGDASLFDSQWFGTVRADPESFNAFK